MAYYGNGKHSFAKAVESCKNDVGKQFLLYKELCHFTRRSDENCVEQYLYNTNFHDINRECVGFVAGRLFGSKEFCQDFHCVTIPREVLIVLGKIYMEMHEENKWPKDEEFKEWSDFFKSHSVY